MSVEKSISKFVQATLAFLKGDTDTTVALKNERMGRAAIKGQLSALEGALIGAEMAQEQAAENLEKAIHPTILINNQESYYNNIVQTKNRLVEAEDELKSIKDSIAYANQLLAENFDN